MTQKDTSSFVFRNIYPRMRYAMGLGRNLYQFGVDLRTRFSSRPLSSSVRPDAYTACNTDTLDSENVAEFFVSITLIWQVVPQHRSII